MRRNISRWLEVNERSVAWLERKAGMSAGALHKSLHQGRQVYIDDLVLIAAATGLSVSDLTRKES